MVFENAPADRAIALALLSELDEAGYLTIPVGALAERLGADVVSVERVLRALPGSRARPACSLARFPNVWNCSLPNATG